MALRRRVMSIPVLGEAIRHVRHSASVLRFPGTTDYWEARYRSGGTSGAGSFGEVAHFKAAFLNDFVKHEHIQSVVEFGCGDGNQLALADYPAYLGLDVSRAAIEACCERFKDDCSKSFLLYEPRYFINHGALTFELALSLDVLFHLVELSEFESHLRHLFSASSNWVVIFASNDLDERTSAHCIYRPFVPWVQEHCRAWELVHKEINPQKGPTSYADFFVFRRRF